MIFTIFVRDQVFKPKLETLLLIRYLIDKLI